MFDKLILVCLLSILFSCTCHENKEQGLETFERKLIEAYELDLKLPNISQEKPNITKAEAYGMQKKLVDHLLTHENIGGFMLSYIEHKQLALDKPLFSVFFESQINNSSEKLDLYGYHHPFNNISLSFKVNKDMTTKVEETSEVVDLIDTCYISYGVYDFNLEDVEEITIEDAISVNIFLQKMILKKEIPLSEIKNGYFSYQSDTFKDGKYMFSESFPKDDTINIYDELKWLINEAIHQGYTIKKGMVLTISGKDRVYGIEAGVYDVYLKGYGKTEVEIHPN